MYVFDIAKAIARAEGYFSEGSLSARANNPGDLKLGDLGHGMIEGKTIFPDGDSGWKHLSDQIRHMLSGNDKLWPHTMTLADAGLKYSGGDPAWAGNVAKELGVYPGITLGQLGNMVGLVTLI